MMETEQEKQERDEYIALLKEQIAFMWLHRGADTYTYDEKNYLLTATYYSPLQKEAIRKEQEGLRDNPTTERP